MVRGRAAVLHVRESGSGGASEVTVSRVRHWRCLERRIQKAAGAVTLTDHEMLIVALTVEHMARPTRAAKMMVRGAIV